MLRSRKMSKAWDCMLWPLDISEICQACRQQYLTLYIDLATDISRDLYDVLSYIETGPRTLGDREPRDYMFVKWLYHF